MGMSSSKSNIKFDESKRGSKTLNGKIPKEKKKKKGFFRSSKTPKLIGKKTEYVEPNSYDLVPPEREVDPDEEVLARLRKSLKTDLETFLLNNILMSVQFFENYEREVSLLRASTLTDSEIARNARLSKYQRHCVSPDKLHELVGKRVRFRAQHGSKKHCTELLHQPRTLVVQDNVELFEGTDSVDYSSVANGPVYRLTLEDALARGFVKLRYDDKRRPTYETIQEKKSLFEEATYSRISGDTPSPRGSEEKTEEVIKEEEPIACEGGTQLTESQKMMLDLQERIEEVGKKELSKSMNYLKLEPIHSGGSQDSIYGKRKFGPRNLFSDPVTPAISTTPTERKLSGMLRNTKPTTYFTPPVSTTKIQRTAMLSAAKSMPNLNEASTSTSPISSKGSVQSDSSGYKSGSQSSRNNLSLPNSRGSEVDYYGYSTIKSYTTPKPLELLRLGNVPVNSSTLPNECFRSVEVPLISKEDEKRRSENGTYIAPEKLFETRQYLKSSGFIASFADVFAEGLGENLGIPNDTIETVTMQGAQLFYETHEEGPKLIPLKIHNRVIPSITSSSWPHAALEWTTRQRKVVTDQVHHIAYTWPTQRMVANIRRLGCHVLPEGFQPTRGENVEQDLEWRLAFPEAERYLESCLSHAQVRCFLFTLALYKNFMEPASAELGLTMGNIRSLLLWQCEKNYAAWPEDRQGETLKKFLAVLYESLMKETLPDYFIKGHNQFEGIPRSHLRRVQEKLCRVQENLIMHVLMMVRNLRYVDEENFYPRLDLKKLYTILTTENIVMLVNPKLARSISQQKIEPESEEESDSGSETDLWRDFRKADPGRQWNRKVNRQIVAEKAAQKLTNEFTRKSIDSIDLQTIPGHFPDSIRRQMILEHLIPHFMEMAKKSNEFRAPKQSFLYIQHAERLTKLLEEHPGNNGSARKLMFQIRNLRDAGKVGIEELKAPHIIQNYTKKLSTRVPESPTTKITMDLPPIPGEQEAKTAQPASRTIAATSVPKNHVVKAEINHFNKTTNNNTNNNTNLHKNNNVPSPHKRVPSLKRLSFVISEEAIENANLVQMLHSPTKKVAGFDNGFTRQQSLTLDEAVEEESTDF